MEINLLVAFTSGVVSFFAPCVVPLLPAYIGYVTGVSLEELRVKGVAAYKKQLVLSSLAYFLGFSVIFVILGTTAASLGSVLRSYDVWIQRGGGILVMLLALSFMGWFQIPWLTSLHGLALPKWADKLGYGRAFVVGIVFATVWTPCVGAVLGAILTLAAASQTVTVGATMLLVYSLGISVPFLVVSLALVQVPGLLKVITKYLGIITKVTGWGLLVIGFLLFNNTVGLISKDLTYNRLNSLLFEIAFKLGYKIR